MLVVQVTYFIKVGKRQDFLDAVVRDDVMGACRREDGCLRYDYFLQADRDDVVLLVERWRDREAQKAHTGQPHMALIRAAKEAFVERTEMDFLDV